MLQFVAAKLSPATKVDDKFIVMNRLGAPAMNKAAGCLLACVVVGGLVGGIARPTMALELVAGGYGALANGDGTEVVPPEAGFGLPSDAEATIGFTPRHAVHLWSRDVVDGSEPLTFEFEVGAQDDGGERLGLTRPDGPEWLRGGRSVGGLSIGGAMRWSDWTVGGGYGRMALMGSDVDLMSASLGWGRLSAEIAYGQASDEQPEPVDVLMLNTELEARSWLTIESNVAVGSVREQEESVAVGRFGVRLNF